MATREWFTRDVVEKALQGASGRQIGVSTVTVEPVVHVGGSCSSTVSSVAAETTEGPMHFVVKTMSTGENTKRFMHMGHTLQRESMMYQKVLPEMLHLLAGRKDRHGSPLLTTPFTPNHVYSGKLPRKHILLEDMTKKGYRVCDRYVGLDMPHAVLAVRTLAVFHAASLAYLVRRPGTVTELENPYDLLLDYFRRTVKKTFPVVAKKCEETDDLERFADVIEYLIPVAADELAESNATQRSRFNVICHGEFWINNLMFRYEGDVVKDVCFVDFQMSHVTSPAADLLFFVVTSLSEEVFLSWWHVLVKEYYISLLRAILPLGLSPPTYEMLNEDIKINSIIAVHASIVFSPVVKAPIPPEEEKVLRKGEYDLQKVFEYKEAMEWLRILLLELEVWEWIYVPES